MASRAPQQKMIHQLFGVRQKMASDCFEDEMLHQLVADPANDQDRDMRFYSWSVISATLSIFSAVLVFSGTTQMLRAYVIPQEEVPRQGF